MPCAVVNHCLAGLRKNQQIQGAKREVMRSTLNKLLSDSENGVASYGSFQMEVRLLVGTLRATSQRGIGSGIQRYGFYVHGSINVPC